MSIADDVICDEEPALMSAPPPLARNWLWRPWYAKLWWTGMIAYWLGKTASFWFSSLEVFYTSALAGFLNILFFPPAILMILGVGFVREHLALGKWELIAPIHDQALRHGSKRGGLDPYTDPLDPRSGPMHWRHLYQEH